MKKLITHTIAILIAGSVLAGNGKKTEGEPLGRAWADRLEYKGIAIVEPDYHVWGSSPVVGPEGNVHLFVARWPVSAKFIPGWYTHCEIARYVSESPEGPFSFKEVILEGTGTSTWDKCAPHNPTIQKIGDNYVLLFIANTGKNFPASQNIGMLTSKSLDGPWEKAGQDGLILSPPTDPSIWSYDSKVGVNNPALLQHPDGRFFLYYKARRQGDVRRMGVAFADKPEGPYVFHKDSLTSNTGEIEDGYAFVENGKFCLLTTDNKRSAGLLWVSDDGVSFDDPILGFDRMEHYIDKKVVAEATNYRGRKFERPQILMQNGHPAYLYASSGANILKGDGSCSYIFRIKEKAEANNPDTKSGL